MIGEMNMGLVKYEEQTLIAARNKIDTCNEKILDALRKIYDETNNISNILNTPKANKNIAEMLNYLDNRINYVGNSKADINQKLITIEAIYREEFINSVEKMVGDNNG